jgi:hypothetical protein
MAASALAWPGWLRRAFGLGLAGRAGEISAEGEPCPAGIRKERLDMVPGKTGPRSELDVGKMLAEAEAQAAAEKKKLLVLVIPDEGAVIGARERGHALGEYLNHGSSADLAPLALAVVVCARMGDLRQAFGRAPAGQPLMVVVDPASRPASLQALDGPLPALLGFARKGGTADPAEDKLVDERIATLAGLVRRGVGEVPGGEVEARAALVQRELVKQRPHGAQWASSSGCGVDYEEGPEVSDAVDCGMGHVPRRSVRFLHFLTGGQKTQR